MSVVIYSARSGRVRRVIFDESCSDATLEKRFGLADDEASLRLDAVFNGIENFDVVPIQNHVSEATGLVPEVSDQ